MSRSSRVGPRVRGRWVAAAPGLSPGSAQHQREPGSLESGHWTLVSSGMGGPELATASQARKRPSQGPLCQGLVCLRLTGPHGLWWARPVFAQACTSSEDLSAAALLPPPCSEAPTASPTDSGIPWRQAEGAGRAAASDEHPGLLSLASQAPSLWNPELAESVCVTHARGVWGR